MRILTAELADDGFTITVTFNGAATGTAEGVTIKVNGVGVTLDNEVLAGSTYVAELDAPLTDPDDLISLDYDPLIGGIIGPGPSELVEYVNFPATNGLAAEDEEPATGYYADQSDVEGVFGVENVREWSNTENLTAPADTDRIAARLADADDTIDTAYEISGYALDDDDHAVATTHRSFGRFTWIAARLAGYELFNHRGSQAANAEVVAFVQAKYEEARWELRNLVMRGIGGSRRANAPDSVTPIGIGFGGVPGVTILRGPILGIWPWPPYC